MFHVQFCAFASHLGWVLVPILEFLDTISFYLQLLLERSLTKYHCFIQANRHPSLKRRISSENLRLGPTILFHLIAARLRAMVTTLPGHQVLPLEFIDRITDEVYDSSNGSSMKDLYNLSLTSRDVGRRATALIFRIVNLTSESDLDNDVSKLRVLFESNHNLAALVRILILDDPERRVNISSPSLLFILEHMRNLNVIKLTDLELPFLPTFANRVNLTDIRLYDVSMTYDAFETILRFSSSLSSLLISNLEIDELHERLPQVGRFSMADLLNEPRAVAWEDPQSPYHGLQPKAALNLPIERLVMKLATPSDHKIMDLLASSRLPIILPGSLKRLAISIAKGALNKAIVERIITSSTLHLPSPCCSCTWASLKRIHTGRALKFLRISTVFVFRFA
ncbi:hypothetical protein IW262DRAFT_319181 [Armillaria fumosa]|nr:hypothetical protein IW262DRAFT_319181 [Armillaria fumosa]